MHGTQKKQKKKKRNRSEIEKPKAVQEVSGRLMLHKTERIQIEKNIEGKWWTTCHAVMALDVSERLSAFTCVTPLKGIFK